MIDPGKYRVTSPFGQRVLFGKMENHKGILAYGTEEIHVSGGAFVVKITGHDLELRAMTGLELLVTGRITQIQLG